MKIVERLQSLWEVCVDKPFDTMNDDFPASQSVQLVDLDLDAGQITLGELKLVCEQPTGWSETHTARMALEERRTEFIFELRNLPADS